MINALPVVIGFKMEREKFFYQSDIQYRGAECQKGSVAMDNQTAAAAGLGIQTFSLCLEKNLHNDLIAHWCRVVCCITHS